MPDFPDLIDMPLVKTWLGFEQETNDETLATLITSVSDAIQRRAGQPLKSAPATYRFTGNGYVSKLLAFWPVTAVTALTSVDASTIAGTPTAETSGTYDVVREEDVYWLRLETGFSIGRRYAATLTVGPAETPGRILEITLEMLSRIVKASSVPGWGKDRAGVASVAISDQATRITTTTTLLNSRKDWLEDIDAFGVWTI